MIKIVDETMGTGKTSAAINMINRTDDDTHFLYITPYLNEVARIKKDCFGKKFMEPKDFGSKLTNIKQLLNKGKNIVSTHALFRLFDEEAIDICRAQNYVLIMDEVADVVQHYTGVEAGRKKSFFTETDLQLLLNDGRVTIEEESGLLRWIDPDYHGKFETEKRLCELESLAVYGGKITLWLFPISVFRAFSDIYILTYMFNAQCQRYYYDYYGVEYKYCYVTGNSQKTYTITEVPQERTPKFDYRTLIQICDLPKLNSIGDGKYDLSLNWFKRNAENVNMKVLKKNAYNYFRNVCGVAQKDIIWTTYKDYKSLIASKGFSKSFVPINARATNAYKECSVVGYFANRFFDGAIKNFFVGKGVNVDEEGYALSEMLQFIWRSAIRTGNPIQLYVPSSRMRRLLEQWITENSI